MDIVVHPVDLLAVAGTFYEMPMCASTVDELDVDVCDQRIARCKQHPPTPTQMQRVPVN